MGIGGRKGHLHVTKSHHADGLPDTQAYAGSDTAIETLDTVAVVDVLEGLADGQVLGSVRVFGLALHLHTDHLDGLVPGRKTTTESRGEDLLRRAELLLLVLARDVTDGGLGQTRETETGAPVRSLADGDRVHAAVDTPDSLPAVDVHEGRKGAGRLHPLGGHLVLGDLHRLHAGAETHGRIGLSDTTGHTSGDTSEEVRSARHLGIVLRLGRDEEEDSALGGGLNPGPRNETLVVCAKMESGAVPEDGARKGGNLQPRIPPRPHIRPIAPAKLSPRLAAMVVLITSSG